MSAKELYYIAIIPPEPVYSRIHNVKLEIADKYGSKQALKSPPHITLLSPFRTESAFESQIIKILTSLAISDPIPISLKGFNRFKGKVLFIDVELNKKLSEFQAVLEQRAREEKEVFNYGYDPRSFNPHITIGFRDWDQHTFLSAWDQYSEKEFEGEFKANSVSLLKHDGKKWETIWNTEYGIENSE